MIIDEKIPVDLEPAISNSQSAIMWKKHFKTIDTIIENVEFAGFEIVEADYAADGKKWWQQYADYYPEYVNNPDHADIAVIKADNGRWLSLGYVIAKKPAF